MSKKKAKKHKREFQQALSQVRSRPADPHKGKPLCYCNKATNYTCFGCLSKVEDILGIEDARLVRKAILRKQR